MVNRPVAHRRHPEDDDDVPHRQQKVDEEEEDGDLPPASSAADIIPLLPLQSRESLSRQATPSPLHTHFGPAYFGKASLRGLKRSKMGKKCCGLRRLFGLLVLLSSVAAFWIYFKEWDLLYGDK